MCTEVTLESVRPRKVVVVRRRRRRAAPEVQRAGPQEAAARRAGNGQRVGRCAVPAEWDQGPLGGEQSLLIGFQKWTGYPQRSGMKNE